MTKGKLIVIDGTDGSGKATQTELLIKNLRLRGYKVAVEDFPQYGKKSAGAVEDYLNGLYGTARELGPFIPSIFYAIDRFAASKRIRKNLKNGKIVISNRYVTANMGHQGGKIRDKKERLRYFRWLYDMEFKLFKIPKPDLNLILHVPANVAQKLIDRKGFRNYIKGKKRDLHEADLKHLKSAEKTYLEISRLYKFPLIKCFEKGQLLSREAIAKKIWSLVKNKLG